MVSNPNFCENHRQALLSDAWFASLSEAIRGDLVAHARMRHLRSGERLFSRGDPSDGVYGVVEGCVRISGINRKGRETILDFYGRGCWIGEVSTLDGLPRTFDADAYGCVVAVQVSPEDLEALIARHPGLARALLWLEANRLRILFAAIETYSTQSLEQRLASRLLRLVNGHGVSTPQGLMIDLHLSQETLAQLIGATRQRVNTILRSWEHDGLLEQRYGTILIREKARLDAFVENY